MDCAIMLITSAVGFFVMPCANPIDREGNFPPRGRYTGCAGHGVNQINLIGGAEKNGY